MATTLGWKQWKQSELDKVEEMKLDGKTNLEIAVALNRTEKAISALCFKKQIKRCLMTPKRYLHLFLANPKATNREIAKMVEVQTDTVRKARQRLRAMGYSI